MNPASNHQSARPVAFIIGLALLTPAVLFADNLSISTDGIPTVRVDYSGLDLSTSSGAAMVYQRLKHAAVEVCRGWESRDLSMRAHWTACYDKALSEAVSRVNKPLVTALHHPKSRQSGPSTLALRADNRTAE